MSAITKVKLDPVDAPILVSINPKGQLKVGNRLFDVDLVVGGKSRALDVAQQKKIAEFAKRVIEKSGCNLATHTPSMITFDGEAAQLEAMVKSGSKEKNPFRATVPAKELRGMLASVTAIAKSALPKPDPKPKAEDKKKAKPAPQAEIGPELKRYQERLQQRGAHLKLEEISAIAKKAPAGLNLPYQSRLKKVAEGAPVGSGVISDAILAMRSEAYHERCHLVDPALFQQAWENEGKGRNAATAQDCKREFSVRFKRAIEARKRRLACPNRVLVPFNTEKSGKGRWALAEINLETDAIRVFDQALADREDIATVLRELAGAYKQAAAESGLKVGQGKWIEEFGERPGEQVTVYWVLSAMQAVLAGGCPANADTSPQAQRFLLERVYGPMIESDIRRLRS